jgi:histidinol phosphatase-like enzyme
MEDGNICKRMAMHSPIASCKNELLDCKFCHHVHAEQLNMKNHNGSGQRSIRRDFNMNICITILIGEIRTVAF